eukprot:5239736-Alexandrium_andersonii.AAC.1
MTVHGVQTTPHMEHAACVMGGVPYAVLHSAAHTVTRLRIIARRMLYIGDAMRHVTCAVVLAGRQELQER